MSHERHPIRSIYDIHEADEPFTAATLRDAIQRQRPGELVRVEQTGGGTATIYFGDSDPFGWYPGVIGPGTYDWGDPWNSKFWPGDTAVGPDDEGETVPSYPDDLDGIVAAAVALLR